MTEQIPIEETVKRIMQDFRARRARHIINNPKSVEGELPDDLSQLAEAREIAKVIQADERATGVNARLLAGCKAAEEWLSGWASAEPYLATLRSAIQQAEGAPKGV
jgi:hypothetical protein